MKQKTPIGGARLRIARKMAGLSLEDLAGKIGGLVTRQALSKYEQGRMSPSPEVLSRIVKVLDMAPMYEESSRARIGTEDTSVGHEASVNFLRCGNRSTVNENSDLALYPEGNRVRDIPSPSSAYRVWSYLEFRRTAPLPKKQEEALKLRALEYLARYEDLERLLGREIAFRNPLSNVEPETIEEIEEAAQKVRDEWSLGLAPIGNLLEVLEANGIKVFEIRDMERMSGFDGLAARSAGGFVIALNMNRPSDRIRFTAAHELAHIICDFEGAGDKETLCHVFAGALLLPRAVLEKELFHRRRKVTLWELGAIKERYGISLQAIMHRARDLELIGPRHLRDFMETVRKNNWSITEPVAYRGKEEAARFKRLLHYAVAERIIGIDRAAALAGTTESKFKKEVGTMV